VTTGIVLAGGRSSRFAARDGGSKLDVDLAGRTILDRSIDALVGSCREVLVVGRESGGNPAARYVPDEAPHEGPLAGLLAGLREASDAIVLVIAGDAPLTRPEVLELLAARLRDSAVDAVVLGEDQDWRPLPLALRREAGRSVLERKLAAGERSIRRALDDLSIDIVAEASWRALDPGGHTLFDVDRAEDVAEATSRLEARLAGQPPGAPPPRA
jgi:molybdopterin-guanine dinucleotide biosynthesis protein A